MGKKKIKYKLLLLLLFLLSNKLFAQEFQPLETQEKFSFDSVKVFVFQDTSQIIEWGKTYYIQSKELHVKEHHIFILRIDLCPWLSCCSCSFIYVFKEKEEQWVFKTGLVLGNPGWFNIKVDDNEERIIFEEACSQLVTDTTNMTDKDVYEIKTGKGKKEKIMLFERIFRKIAEIPFEAFLDSE